MGGAPVRRATNISIDLGEALDLRVHVLTEKAARAAAGGLGTVEGQADQEHGPRRVIARP